MNIDDRLRQVPGFSLFRRTSSIVANPTTQGVSLRGIGSTGASRTLVLWDGVPMNDPFGGWVYWTRFPPDDLRRVEISRGASTSVFGDLAMSGAIGLFSRELAHRHFSGGYEGGNENSQDVWAGYSDLWSHFAISGSGRAYRTDGYYVVPGYARGSVDRPANVEFVTGDLHLDLFRGVDRLFAQLNILAEDRQNGTELTHNSTSLGTASLHYVREAAHDEISFLAFRTQEQFHSDYSSVAANRNSERVTLIQTVPSNGNGADLLWNHHGGFWNTAVGADVNQNRGFSDEATVPTGYKVSGGTLLQHGEFVQTDLQWHGARFFLGARHQFTGQDRQFFSPSGGFAYGRGRWRTRGSVYRAFRAPTLNELYRQFRVGNTVTLANNALVPETLFGAEAGADFITETGAIRVTVFRNSLGNLITNATLSSTPALITRQRQNGAHSISRGVEFSAGRRWREWHAEAGYLFVDSRYATGPRIPQVPKHQGSAQVSYERGGTLASVGFRSYSAQFDDDLNQFRLPGFATVQAVVRQRITKWITADLALENVLDHQYYTGFTPTPTVGAPTLVRAGVRFSLP
ncbi:MAG: TonB-dependent receptor, plug [Bryobacterales bacterium]|nr:TonB-dependent receptor, plug [Bryobacterales bacterium]